MAASALSRPLLYNKNNRIVIKLNEASSVEEMKKKAPEEVAHRIDTYLMVNNVTTMKLRAARTLPSRDVAINIDTLREAQPKLEVALS